MQVTIKFVNWKTKIKKISINASYLCTNGGFGFGSKSNLWNPGFLTGHYGNLELQRRTSIEAHNASVRRRPMRMPYPSILLFDWFMGWGFWEKRRRMRERERRWRGFEERDICCRVKAKRKSDSGFYFFF